MLLVRLTDTVILWLSEDQAFWEEIEEGPRPLGPFGLQQVFEHIIYNISNQLSVQTFSCDRVYS